MFNVFIVQESIIDRSEESQLQAAILASQMEHKCREEKRSSTVKPSDVTNRVMQSDSEDDEDVETFSGLNICITCEEIAHRLCDFSCLKQPLAEKFSLSFF